MRYLQLGVLLMAVFFLALGGIRMAGASGSRKGLPRNPNEGQTFDAANIREVVLAGGCFWGVQAFLDRVPGVAGTEVGYANGSTKSPTYEQVCQGDTGHAEAVRVRYDASRLPLDKLLTAFFSIIDPTSKNRQGADFGAQYRTGVYLTGPSAAEDRAAAERVFAVEAKKHEKPLSVELEPLKSFYPAEEYHQKYCRQLDSTGSTAERDESARMPDVPLTTGTSRERMEMPIMGPPARTFTGSSVKPPAASTSSRTGVPSGTCRFLGLETTSPVTETIRSMTGIPCVRASQM